jgi:mannose-6-phosphate isomerase-like protein (cupin superfamily)
MIVPAILPVAHRAKIMKTRYASVEPYTTLDGSQIRELMHPAHHAAHGNRAQSFAEAIVAPGATTRLHRHHVTEEIYHITQGAGRMTLGDMQFDVAAGDTICITPGTLHCISCAGEMALKILCACSPAYSHDDTELL